MSTLTIVAIALDRWVEVNDDIVFHDDEHDDDDDEHDDDDF